MKVSEAKRLRQLEVENRKAETVGGEAQLDQAALTRIMQCAVKRRRFSVGAKPTRQLSLQPVAMGGVEEVTNLLKPSV